MSQNESNATKYPHYFKSVKNLDYIDVYRVLQLFEVTDNAVGHAVKKLLCAGSRGSKDFLVDITEAYHTLNRVIEMQAEMAPVQGKCLLSEQSSGVANFGGVPVPPTCMFPPRPNPNWMDEKSPSVQPVDVIGGPLNRPIADIKHSVGEATSKAAQALQASLVGTPQAPKSGLPEEVVVTEMSLDSYKEALDFLLSYNTAAKPNIEAISVSMIKAFEVYVKEINNGHLYPGACVIGANELKRRLSLLRILNQFEINDSDFVDVFKQIVEKLK